MHVYFCDGSLLISSLDGVIQAYHRFQTWYNYVLYLRLPKENIPVFMDTIVRNININTYLEYNPILGTFRVFDFWGVLNLFALCSASLCRYRCVWFTILMLNKLNMFDHFVGLTLKVLKEDLIFTYRQQVRLKSIRFSLLNFYKHQAVSSLMTLKNFYLLCNAYLFPSHCLSTLLHFAPCPSTLLCVHVLRHRHVYRDVSHL